MNEPTRFCTFYVNGLFFGVDVLKIQEVINQQEMTRVPNSSRIVSGLINLRGQIVTAIDLRRRLGFEDRSADAEPPMNIVIHASENILSLVVDSIGDVIETSEESYERPPESLDPKARELITAVYKLHDKLLLILDAEKTMRLPDAA